MMASHWAQKLVGDCASLPMPFGPRWHVGTLLFALLTQRNDDSHRPSIRAPAMPVIDRVRAAGWLWRRPSEWLSQRRHLLSRDQSLLSPFRAPRLPSFLLRCVFEAKENENTALHSFLLPSCRPWPDEIGVIEVS